MNFIIKSTISNNHPQSLSRISEGRMNAANGSTQPSDDKTHDTFAHTLLDLNFDPQL